MPLAFTRQVSPRIVDCALTHLDRRPIDPDLAASQHAAYEQALADGGYEVIRLPDLPGHPDAVFVEDSAILLGRHAIVTRPGATSRLDEIHSTAEGLQPYFTVHRLPEGTLDGGDVLRIGAKLYVGQSNRTNALGTAALARLAGPLGYQVVPVELGRCLHLKTAVTCAGDDRDGKPVLLINADWVDSRHFGDASRISVAESEPFAANVVRLRDRVIMAAGSPRTAAKLRDRGFEIVELDLSELQKAEAGGTCMSLIAD